MVAREAEYQADILWLPLVSNGIFRSVDNHSNVARSLGLGIGVFTALIAIFMPATKIVSPPGFETHSVLR